MPPAASLRTAGMNSESSVLSLLAEHVTCADRVFTARLSVVMGRQASQVALVSYHRWDDLLSSIDLWIRW